MSTKIRVAGYGDNYDAIDWSVSNHVPELSDDVDSPTVDDGVGAVQVIVDATPFYSFVQVDDKKEIGGS